MKLVNVDEINDTTIPMMYLDYNRNDWVQCKIITKDAPEVKAIPIEWLKEYEIKNGQEVRLQSAIEKWEKENELAESKIAE